MSSTARTVRRSGKKGVETTAAHAVRTPNDLWAQFTRKCERLGLSRNRVIVELMIGWVRGVYRLPTRQVEEVRTYPDAGSQPAVAPAQ